MGKIVQMEINARFSIVYNHTVYIKQMKYVGLIAMNIFKYLEVMV